MSEKIRQENSAITFGPGADRLADDYDVLMGYQIFLERNPENSLVIQENKSRSIRAMIRSLMNSPEYGGLAAQPLALGARLVHARSGAVLNPEQISWIRDLLSLSEEQLPTPGRGTSRRAFVLVHIDSPKPDEVLPAGAELNGKGWVIAKADIQEISVYLDETFLCYASFGLPRPEVAEQFPHYQQAKKSGFHFSASLGRYAVGSDHRTLVIAVRTADGAVTRKEMPLAIRADMPTEPAGTLAASQTASAPAMLTPPPQRSLRDDAVPARSEMPDTSNRIYIGIDNPRLDGDRAMETLCRALTVAGWAVAQGGIGAVEVRLDERSPIQAHMGVRREDIAVRFPDNDQAPFSGFAVTIPHRMIGAGEHTIRVLVHAKSGHVAERTFHLVSGIPDDTAGMLRSRLPQAEIDLRSAVLQQMGSVPFYLILVRASGLAPADVQRVRTTLETVHRQAYSGWRALVMLPQGSNEARAAATIGGDQPNLLDRVRVQARSGAREGGQLRWPDSDDPQFLVVLSAGDRLGADALLELATASGLDRSADFIYSDERCHDAAAGAVQPWLKPDWSPDTLLAMNYIGRVWCASRDLIERAAITPEELAVHGEYDAVLRLTEQARIIAHVPRVLSERGERSLDSPEAERRALQRALERRGLRADALPGRTSGSWRVRPAEMSALVSIIIPTSAERGAIRNAIRTIRERTAYPHIEIVCVDAIPAKEKKWKAWLRRNADQVVPASGSFAWSRLSNAGAAAARGEFLLFLSEEIEARDPDWLEALLEPVQRPEVGVVGAQLLSADGTVQQAGMFVSDSAGRCAFRFAVPDAPGPFGQALVRRNVIAVAGACMLVRRSVFQKLGGFASGQASSNSDAEFCLRVWRSGQRVVTTPFATLTHNGQMSGAKHGDIADRQIAKGDPFFNPGLAADLDDYSVEPEPVEILYAGHPLLAREQVRRILAMELGQIGDFVTALPVLRRLKQRFPAAELTVLAARSSLPVAALEPAIDRCIDCDLSNGQAEFGQRKLQEAEREELRAKLKPYRFDVAIDLGMQTETRDILRCTGATLLAGFDHGGRFPWLDIAVEWEGDIRLLPKRAPVADRLMMLAEAVDIACEPELPTLQAITMQQARARLLTLPVAREAPAGFFDRPLVCVHPGAGNAMRQWPAESYAALIDLLIAEEGVHIVLIGGAEEAPTAQKIAALADSSAVFSLVGRLGMAELPGVLQACALFVGSNSGPEHIAAALGVPTVGVHSGNVDARERAPLGPCSVAVRRNVVCGPCYLSRPTDCHRNLACLTGIRPADVYRACRPLLHLRTSAEERQGAARTSLPREVVPPRKRSARPIRVA